MTDLRATPLVSVVIPIYNVAPYLPQCLASIQGQTYSNLDIVCVDDGSTDASAVIVKEALATDDRIRLVSTENGGLGRARNLGLDQTRGEYLAFLDSDDVMPAPALERMVETARSTGSDIVSGRVLRFSGTHSWPSGLHERAIGRARLRTHISRNLALLHDTTAWNKLYAGDLWRDNNLRFPEGVLYEDIQVTLEAHCRARAVDTISDVVYHWRQRENGDLSITQQRLDLVNLEDRMRSLGVVRSLLAELATGRLQEAAAYKHLASDIKLYLRELLKADPAYQERFAVLVGEYLSGVPEPVLRRLPPQMAIEYHLVRSGQLAALLRLLQHEQSMNWRLPAVRRGLSMHLDVGPVAASVPSSITRVRRRLPMRVGVDTVFGAAGKMVIEGFAFIDHVPMATPVSQLRRLRLVETTIRRSLSVWLVPRRHDHATIRYGRPGADYSWSGFRAEIPIEKLAPPAGSESATWSVVVQALSPLAAKGSTLGPPVAGTAWFPPVHWTGDGLVCTSSWGQDQRLRLTVRRSPGAIVAAAVSAGRLRLELRLDSAATRQADQFLLHPDGGEPLAVPLQRVDGGPVVAEVDVAQLASARQGAPFVVFQPVVLTPTGAVRLDTELIPEMVLQSTADDAVLLRANAAGRAEILVTPPRVAVTDARWDGDRLVIGGLITLEVTATAGLEWRNGRGERLLGVEHRVGERFETSFEPLAVPGPEGPHLLSSGGWDLYRHDARTGRTMRAFVARGGPAAVEAAHRTDPVDVRLWVDRHSLLAMKVHALPPHERGAHAQAKLRRGPYRRARGAKLWDAVLFESWQGKQYSDNPRALVEEALRRPGRPEILVSVADPSVLTPAGVRPVLRWSREYFEALARARVVVSNDSMTAHFVKRAGQQYVQTWHGTPLKRIGFDLRTIHFRNQRYLEEFALEVRKWDRLVSPNAYSTEILRSAFRYDGEILETGYPRNDLLLQPEAVQVRRRTREWLGIDPGKTVVLWAPTWRDNQFAEGHGYSFPMVLDLDRLRQQIGDDHVILFRGHSLISASLGRMPGGDAFFRNVSGHPDIRDLYCASDVLVTDYSSTMFDYAVTGRPILHLAWDLPTYRDVLRGLYLELDEVAAGPVLTNGDQLAAALQDLPAVVRQHEQRYRAFRERFCALEDGRAAARVWDALNLDAGSGPGNPLRRVGRGLHDHGGTLLR